MCGRRAPTNRAMNSWVNVKVTMAGNNILDTVREVTIAGLRENLTLQKMACCNSSLLSCLYLGEENIGLDWVCKHVI